VSQMKYFLGLSIIGLLVAAFIKFLLPCLYCEGFSADTDHFMAYCNSKGHGHYDHAAYLFETENGLYDMVKNADVLFLGSSRIQDALSTNALTEWTISKRVQPYLLGFGYKEQDIFAAELLKKIRPKPKLVIINVDPFFSSSTSAHAHQLLESPISGWLKALTKKVLHSFNEIAFRSELPLIEKLVKGTISTVYRSRKDGRWIWRKERRGTIPVAEIEEDNKDMLINQYASNAESFLQLLPVKRQCVVLTNIPSAKTNTDISKVLAKRLGTGYVAPYSANLMTTDGSHLDSASSELWTSAFLKDLEPFLALCLKKGNGDD
jgi:hypothetical protein